MKTPLLARIALLSALTFSAAPQVFCFPAGADNFASATVIDPYYHISDYTDLTNLTKESMEPDHGSKGTVGAGHTAWWKWTAPATGFCTLDTRESLISKAYLQDTVISVYSGDTLSSLTRIAANDNFEGGSPNAGPFLSQVTFYAQQGETYRIAVDASAQTVFSPTNYVVYLKIRLLPLRRTVFQSLVASIGSGPLNLGSVSVVMTATATYSGKLNLAGKVYSFTGVFSADGRSREALQQKAAKNAPPLPPIVVELEATQGGNCTVMLPDGTLSKVPLYPVVVFTAVNPNSVTGLYNMPMSFEHGRSEGLLSITVTNTGSLTGTGMTHDGTKITFGGALVKPSATSTNFGVLGYQPTFAGKGGFLMIGELSEEGVVDRFVGQGFYGRPVMSPPSAFYPEGITTSLQLKGCTYQKPLTNKRALGFLDSVANDGAGTLKVTHWEDELEADIALDLTLSLKNKFIFASSPMKPALTLNPATGLVTGTIVEGGLKRAIRGILSRYQGKTTLRGHVTGATQNVLFEVVSAP